MTKLKWTEAALRSEAAKYDTRNAFRKGSPSAYTVACRMGLIGDLGLDRTLREWDYAALHAEALKYTNRRAFALGSKTAYNLAGIRGIRDAICAHMSRPVVHNKRWTEDSITAVAKACTTRKEFHKKFGCAWRVAQSLGVDSGLLDHLPYNTPSDEDCIYLWKASGVFFAGLPVYKVGVTSARLNQERIAVCSKASGFTAELVFIVWTGKENARKLEKDFLACGVNPGFEGFDGATEFRALDDSDVALMHSAAVPLRLL